MNEYFILFYFNSNIFGLISYSAKVIANSKFKKNNNEFKIVKFIKF